MAKKIKKLSQVLFQFPKKFLTTGNFMEIRNTRHRGYQETRYINKSKSTPRTQMVLFKTYRRNILFNKKYPLAGSILSYVASFSEYCYIDNLKILAAKLNVHEHTIRRAINYLVRIGLIVKKYCHYKKLRLETATREEQERLVDNPIGACMNTLSRLLNKKKKKNQILNHDRAQKYEPNKSHTREANNTEKKVENQKIMQALSSNHQKQLELIQKKNEMLLQYRKIYNL